MRIPAKRMGRVSVLNRAPIQDAWYKKCTVASVETIAKIIKTAGCAWQQAEGFNG